MQRTNRSWSELRTTWGSRKASRERRNRTSKCHPKRSQFVKILFKTSLLNVVSQSWCFSLGQHSGRDWKAKRWIMSECPDRAAAERWPLSFRRYVLATLRSAPIEPFVSALINCFRFFCVCVCVEKTTRGDETSQKRIRRVATRRKHFQEEKINLKN